MATGHWKLEVNKEVPAADLSAHLGNGPFLVLRTDTRDGKTTIHFAGDDKDVAAAKFATKPVGTRVEDIAKL
ncbi:MAG: hypothetical protein QOJ84_3391 [Bradyrhizobium sp.]|nr:hypothetical protein [Bradyrhizobium sp.]